MTFWVRESNRAMQIAGWRRPRLYEKYLKEALFRVDEVTHYLLFFFFEFFFLTYCAFFGLNVIIFLEFVLNQVIDKIKKKLLEEESFVA